MTSTAKSQKDKPNLITPRIIPRPTAASAARAARNATNRNVNVTAPQKQSPTRSSPVLKAKHPQRMAAKADPKPDHKPDPKPDIKNLPPEDQFLIPDNIGLPPSPEDPVLSGETIGNLENINENSEFEEKKEDTVEIQNQIECENPLVSSKPPSRPNTPTPPIRPQTPSSRPTSRPQTPQIPSRPMTPVHPNQHHSTPTSRPNTPQPVSTRPTTPALPPRTPTPTARPAMKEDGDVKSVFIMKQKQYNNMKKELDLKQRAVLELFDTLRNLRDQLAREGVSGCGEGNVNELVVFNVADWSTEEVSQLCRDAVSPSAVDGAVDLINTAVPIDEGALSDLVGKLINVPGRFADLCLQAFTARQELIDWVKELIEANAFKDETCSDECLERTAQYNAQGLVMCEALREIKNLADEAVNTVTQLSRKACQERSALVVVGESLVREVARLRNELDSQANILHELKEMRPDTETSKALDDTRRQLESEKASGLALKDKLSTAESQLRQTRIRVNKMDRQLREAEASITSLTATVKTLEDQSRQREVQLEARARKLKESLKTGEVTSSQLIQHRDALQNEVTQLKEQIENFTTQHKNAVQDLTNQLNVSINAFEEERKESQREREAKEAAEAALVESQSKIEELKTKIIELENSKHNPDLPTEREMDLWAELQATKEALRVTEEEVATTKRDKARFLESLTKIAESENKVGMQQKLAAELLSKEETVAKMQIQIRELTKNIKLNEQKVVQYEQYVRELQAHNRAVANNCQESPNGISYEDLQQEIMDLKMSLLEAVHRNEELNEILVQKEQQLEQQDKTSRTQARVIKVREELINMLKNKETEQSRELTAMQQDLEHRMKVVDEVNRQIAAKAEEIQELFSTLENKQQQIQRLEKIVLALEEQQRRAQAQRTRHEEKIAALEHELAASGNRRESKFLFF